MANSSAFSLFTDIPKQYCISSLFKNLMIGRCSVRGKLLKQDGRWSITLHCVYSNHFQRLHPSVRLHATAEECSLWFTGGHIICGQVEYSWSALLFCTSEACYPPSLPALTLTDVISRKHMKLRYKILTVKQLCCTQCIWSKCEEKLICWHSLHFTYIFKTPDLYNKVFPLQNHHFGKC